MGIGVDENGNESIGRKNKYHRMDKETEGEIGIAEEHETKGASKKYVFLCAVFASLNSVLLGYDVGVMSGAIIFIQKDLKITNSQVEILVGILSIISLIGCLAGGKTSDAIGRKCTIGLAAVVFQTGAAIMALAPSYRVLMAGRLLAGIGIGFGVMIAPVYIVEIAPSVARGALTSFPEIFVNFGILLGYISNYAFSGLPAHINWRIMLGVGILPSIFLIISLFVIPESPRWLVVQNRIEEARLVLLKINDSEKEANERLAEIQVAAVSANAGKYETRSVWRELSNPTPPVFRMLIAGCGIQCFQQVTGIDSVTYYSPVIFKEVGIEGDTQRLAATVAVGFTKTVCILIAILLIDKVGRRPLLYVSTIGMTACLFCLGLALSLMRNRPIGIVLAILSVCGDAAFFSIGIGPICWVISSEIFPLRLRAQASALGAVGSRVSSGLVSMSFLSAANIISMGGTFFVFTLISISAVAFVHWCVPETKGKTLEQIEMMFQNDGEHKAEVEMGDGQHLAPKNDPMHS